MKFTLRINKTEKDIGDVILNQNHLKDGDPCSPGCVNHVTHPCEKCGRTQAKGEIKSDFRAIDEQITPCVNVFLEEDLHKAVLDNLNGMAVEESGL